MLVKYIAIWKIHGATALTDEEAHSPLACTTQPIAEASLTDNPEAYFFHIDRSRALAALTMRGLFGPSDEGTPAQRLQTELDAFKQQREKELRGGVFLIVQGETEAPDPQRILTRELDEFAVCFDGADKSAIRETFRPISDAALTALGISIGTNLDREFEKVGEVIYLQTHQTSKPTYTFTFTGHAPRISVAGALKDGALESAKSRSEKLLADRMLSRPSRLLNTSHDRRTDPLQRFLSAWSALEIFVNRCFSADYEQKWFAIMEAGAPTAATPIFERFKSVMHDKYRLNDRFLIIAAVLAPDQAAEDLEKFSSLKKVRDNLLHGAETPEQLPTETSQQLLAKYLSLHLDSH